MLTTLNRFGLVHNASHGGTIGIADIAESVFHQHGLVKSTGALAVRIAGVVASSSERHLGAVKHARTSVFSKLRVGRCD